MSRKRKFPRKLPYDAELIAVYSAKNEFLHDALKYMFFANGGAITGVLIKFDIHKFQIPIFVFAAGILYTILTSLLMYFHTRHIMLWSLNHKIFPFNYYINRKWHYKILNIVIPFFIYIPGLTFLYGIILTIQTLLGVQYIFSSDLLF